MQANEQKNGISANPVRQESNLTLDNREKLQISGVIDVISYHEGEVLIQTAVGTLRVLGEKLQIQDLSVSSHRCLITGQVDGMLYEKTVSQQKLGFWGKVFG